MKRYSINIKNYSFEQSNVRLDFDRIDAEMMAFIELVMKHSDHICIEMSDLQWEEEEEPDANDSGSGIDYKTPRVVGEKEGDDF